MALGLLDPRRLLLLQDVEHARIVSALDQFGSCDAGRLGPVFEALDGAWD